jgi:LuxR family maltose regulon positive regulatory protein
VIEILILLALAHRARGHISAALEPLERALTLAEPEGYVRTFVEEGEPMRDLLRHAVAVGSSSAYARRLLAAFETRPPVPNSESAVSGLVEPLTARERRGRWRSCALLPPECGTRKSPTSW